MKPQYIIVAGVNGAGKSTLYEINPGLFKGTRRINADEWLRENGGNWRNLSDSMKAMKAVVKDLKQSLDNEESIHQETTLSGAGKPFLNLINKAHAKGYEVTLLYIKLDSPETAINRVSDRVKKGGHGVDSDLIRKRYVQSLKNLKKISKVVDRVKIYDNTKDFTLHYYREKERIVFDICKGSMKKSTQINTKE
ncbi:zeta toxin family protein [Streptococcus sp. zg-JUN1979]|uniref:zeta toxin family protein n=1 Tax=Streptococcus sp. zg-JUN1979 TaxID=3391450 RepID=UPI0039A66BB6